MKNAKEFCIRANVDMLTALVEDLGERMNTAQIDLSENNFNAAVGGLIELDGIFDQCRAIHIAAIAAYRARGRAQ